jgi:hypothetical protein
MNFELIALSLSFALISSPIWTNVSYAQLLQPGAGNEQFPQKVIPGRALSSKAGLSALSHGVRITSPTKGQEVPIGKDLMIAGISISNATSHCQVFVIVNSVKPYQNATANGPGGASDYSKWNFVLTSKYTAIKEGPNNKITAKQSCTTNPGKPSFYSVYITGVLASTVPSAPRGNPTMTPP